MRNIQAEDEERQPCQYILTSNAACAIGGFEFFTRNLLHWRAVAATNFQRRSGTPPKQRWTTSTMKSIFFRRWQRIMKRRGQKDRIGERADD